MNVTKGLWSKRYTFSILTNFFIYIGFYLLVPTLPAYIKQIGGTGFEAGLVVSIFSITALLARFIVDIICNRIGKKAALFLAFSVIVIPTLMYLFVPLKGVLAFRTLQGIGWGVASTTLAALISEIVPEKRRGEGMGYYSLSMIVGMSIAPVVAIMVMNKFNFIAIDVASIAFIVIGMLLLRNVNIKRVVKNDKNKNTFKFSDVFEKKAVLPGVLCFLLAITLCGVMSYIMLYGKELGMNNIWIYFAGHVAMVMISRPLIGKILDKRGHAIVILPGAVSMIIGLIILSNVNSVFILVIASMFYGLGYGAVQPSLQVWAVNRSPEDRKVAANGTFLSSMDLGFTFGALILGAIAENKSYALMYRYSAIFMIIFLVIYVYTLIKSQKVKNEYIEDDENIEAAS